MTTIDARTLEGDRIRGAALQAFWLLRIGFTAAPILFGIDKFFNWTVHWPDRPRRVGRRSRAQTRRSTPRRSRGWPGSS
jgi:hypothetical protein